MPTPHLDGKHVVYGQVFKVQSKGQVVVLLNLCWLWHMLGPIIVAMLAICSGVSFQHKVPPSSTSCQQAAGLPVNKFVLHLTASMYVFCARHATEAQASC